MKNDNFWLLLINAIDNLGIMAAWTILAIFFNKWWIALFAILCFTSIKVRTKRKKKKMSDRKFIRGAMRAYARKHDIKESKYIRTMFDRLQVNKYGATRRKINQAKATTPKRLWRLRVASVLEK